MEFGVKRLIFYSFLFHFHSFSFFLVQVSWGNFVRNSINIFFYLFIFIGYCLFFSFPFFYSNSLSYIYGGGDRIINFYTVLVVLLWSYKINNQNKKVGVFIIFRKGNISERVFISCTSPKNTFWLSCGFFIINLSLLVVIKHELFAVRGVLLMYVCLFSLFLSVFRDNPFVLFWFFFLFVFCRVLQVHTWGCSVLTLFSWDISFTMRSY